MPTYIIQSGSNISPKEQYLGFAQSALSKLGDIEIQSSIRGSKAWGLEDQEDFINQSFVVKSDLAPQDMLAALQKIENEAGRLRNIKWGPRTLDLDILFCEDKIINAKSLTIPHPYIQDREFVVKQLVEIIPDFIHPILKKSVTMLCEELDEKISLE